MKRYPTIEERINQEPELLKKLVSNESISTIFDHSSHTISPQRRALFRDIYEGNEETISYLKHLPNNNKLYVKLEHLNSLGNNHYSRYWVPYIFIAELLGIITPGVNKLLDISSGSAGISLAMAANALGYDSTIIIPKCLPVERRRPMLEYGAQLIEVDGFIKECIARLKREIIRGNYFPTNHAEDKANVIIHVFKRIAHEHFLKFGAPDYCILGLGNGSTTYAIFDYFSNYGSKNITYFPEHMSRTVLGLYYPNVQLRHIGETKQYVNQIIDIQDIDNSMIDSFICLDSNLSLLGESSKFGIAIAYNKALNCTNKTFFTIGYDTVNRY
jgi:cysteine synthase